MSAPVRPTARTRSVGALLAAVALLATAGCSSDDDQPGSAASPQGEPSVSQPSVSQSSSPQTSTSPSASASGTTTTRTTTAQPTTALLDWTPLPGDPSGTVTTNGTQTLTIARNGRAWTLESTTHASGGGSSSGSGQSVPKGQRIMKAGLDDDYAVVVYGNDAGTRAQTAVITALASGKRTTLDASSELPPAADGSWALEGATLWHATGGATSPYCLVSTDLASMTSQQSWCAGAHDGFTNILASPDGVSMMVFDDKRPTSCRTLVAVTGSTTTPYADVPACKGSQGVALGGGTVWTMVPNEHRYQQVHVYASTPDSSAGGTGVVDLGLGVNGTLTRCGDSVFWAKDRTGSTAPALMRWDGSALTTAFEAKAFLGQPLCAGSVLSIVESGDSGDRQLSAVVD